MGDKYAKFGILAGISSFLFQLPVRPSYMPSMHHAGAATLHAAESHPTLRARASHAPTLNRHLLKLADQRRPAIGTRHR